MDEHKKREIEAQLELWGTEIARRAAALAPADRKVRFTVLQHVDELKILYATARARFASLTAVAAGEQADLEEEFTDAWSELAATIDKPLPR